MGVKVEVKKRSERVREFRMKELGIRVNVYGVKEGGMS